MIKQSKKCVTFEIWSSQNNSFDFKLKKLKLKINRSIKMLLSLLIWSTN